MATGPRLELHEPEFRVLRLPRWRREPERIVVEDVEADGEQSWNLWTAEVLEALAAGETYAQMVERVHRRRPDRRRARVEASVRRFLYTLHRLKAVELALDSPAAFASGRYEVVKELGRGGVGVAWLCREAATGRELVVKRAWDYFAPLARTDALVREEAEVMRALDHPRIAKAYDGFEEDGRFHLVRELVQGEELSRWRGRGVDDALARRRLALDVADIVAHLHDRGYLLLDLRPANFFVDPSTMRAMLIDVGHCKPLVEGRVELGAPARGKSHGSPGFAAPETYEGHATVRTDVWGFGRLYFFVATGQLPKPATTTADLDARMAAAGRSEEERRLVARCADDDPAGRPASMREAAALLAARS